MFIVAATLFLLASQGLADIRPSVETAGGPERH